MKICLLYLAALLAAFSVNPSFAQDNKDEKEIRATFAKFSAAYNAGDIETQLSFVSPRFKAQLAHLHLVEAEFATMGQGVNKELFKKWGQSLQQHFDKSGLKRTGSALKMANTLVTALSSWEDLDKFSIDQVSASRNVSRPNYSLEISDLKITDSVATAKYTVTTHKGLLGCVLDQADVKRIGLPETDVKPVPAAVYFAKTNKKWRISLPQIEKK